jgi:hypothetical protein
MNKGTPLDPEVERILEEDDDWFLEEPDYDDVELPFESALEP